VIAVVDDDDSFRMALAESLRSLGYDAKEFASAEELCKADAEEPYDCVITDICMPGMSGLELSQLLTSRAPALPVITMTAVPTPDLKTKAAASGSFDVLEKPFEADALLDCLRRALEG